MAVWNRRVTVTQDNQYLQVDNQISNPNPPGASDPPNSITTHGTQRPATINYLAIANGPRVNGIQMKDGSQVPSWLTYSSNGPNLQLVNNGGPGTSASYYLTGTWNNSSIRSQDPQIHNQ
jgi:hypothetical protein